MGQSILRVTIETIAEEALVEMAGNVNRYILKEDYRLGEGYCSFKQIDSEITYGIIHDNYCEIVRILEGTLKGQGSIYEPDMKRRGKITENTCCKQGLSRDDKTESNNALYQLWLSRGNTGTMDDFLDAIFKDEKMDWYEVNWS